MTLNFFLSSEYIVKRGTQRRRKHSLKMWGWNSNLYIKGNSLSSKYPGPIDKKGIIWYNFQQTARNSFLSNTMTNRKFLMFYEWTTYILYVGFVAGHFFKNKNQDISRLQDCHSLFFLMYVAGEGSSTKNVPYTCFEVGLAPRKCHKSKRLA